MILVFELLFIAFIIVSLITSVLGIMLIKVKKVSTTYKNIVNINKITYFHNIEPIYPINAVLNSKKEFDNYAFDEIMQEALKREQEVSKINMIIDQAKKNKKTWSAYTEKIDGLNLTVTEKDSNKTLMPNFIYKKLEAKIIKEEKKKRPVINPRFRLIQMYTSPKGRNHYQATKDYTIKDINYYQKYLKEKEKKEIEFRQSTAYQRKLMTPSLRYDILKRDEFKCQLCGYSQEDGVKLHVDHIVPVAKGGRTKKNNLRTLCEACNIGKSHKYDSQGVN